MFAQVIHILLIAALLACPLACDRAALGAGEDQAAASHCSHCRAKSRRPSRDPAEHVPGDDPSENCQCLCGGAVLKDSSADELLEFSTPLSPILVAAEISRPAAAGADHPPDPPLPDGGANVGRMLCSWHMSRLC